MSISFILIMMKELVTQTASDTLGTDERNAIKSEIDELSSEVGDIVSETQFNGIALVNGTYTGISFQTGEGTSVYALICDYSESHGAASLSVASGDVSNNITNAASAASALTNVNGAIDLD